MQVYLLTKLLKYIYLIKSAHRKSILLTEINAEGGDLFFMKDNSTIKFQTVKGKVNGLVFNAMGLGVVIVIAQKVSGNQTN